MQKIEKETCSMLKGMKVQRYGVNEKKIRKIVRKRNIKEEMVTANLDKIMIREREERIIIGDVKGNNGPTGNRRKKW